LLLVAGCLLLVPTTGAAQPAAPARQAASPGSPAPSHLAAARQLLEILNMEETAMAGMMIALEQQMEAMPEMEDCREVMMEWGRDLLRSATAKNAFATMYAEEISEADLRQMIAFYETPAGQRIAARQSALALRGAEVGHHLAEAQQADLIARLQRREAELQNR
jgi:uncharacterized protein